MPLDKIISRAVDTGIQRYFRNNIEMEKGAILTTARIEKNRKLYEKYCTYFSTYPDLFIDLITPQSSNFQLFFYQRIFLRACMRYRYHYCTACLTKDTPILTEKGMIPIQKVDVNKRVWTKDGWQYPLNLNIREWNNGFVKIVADNCFEEKITVTEDHRFLTVRREKRTTRPGIFWEEGKRFFNIKDYNARKEIYRKALRECHAEWVKAKDLGENDWLLSPIDITVNDIDEMNVSCPSKKMKNQINKSIAIDNNFCEWLGIWLAEGSWTDRQILFTIGLSETRLRNRVIELTKQIFDLSCTVKERDNNSQVLTINSKHLCNFFEELFSCTCNDINQWNKWIPEKLLYIDPSKQLQIVKGWLDGDGYYRITGNSHRYKGTTVSNVLVEGMKIILYRNYVNPSITTEHRENKAAVYNLNFNGRLAEEFHKAILDERAVIVTNEMRLGEYYPRLIDGKLYMINKVRSVEKIDCDEKLVYCLEMPNGSFNVNGVEGHNCRAFSKTFVSILALILKCIFQPRSKLFICAPGKEQSAKVAKEKIVEIFNLFPLLKKEIIGEGNFGKDYVTLNFRNGSQFDVVGANLRPSLIVI